jgi:hypothetical protein
MTPDLPQTTGSEIQTFVENTINEIYNGVKKCKFMITEPIRFELEVTERKEGEGSLGFKQFIRIGGKKEGESSQKISFSVKPDPFEQK